MKAVLLIFPLTTDQHHWSDEFIDITIYRRQELLRAHNSPTYLLTYVGHDNMLQRYDAQLTGSSIKLLTPVPTDSTTIVALPYRAYPAATTCRPDCRASLTVAGPSDTCTHNSTIKSHQHVHLYSFITRHLTHDEHSNGQIVKDYGHTVILFWLPACQLCWASRYCFWRCLSVCLSMQNLENYWSKINVTYIYAKCVSVSMSVCYLITRKPLQCVPPDFQSSSRAPRELF